MPMRSVPPRCERLTRDMARPLRCDSRMSRASEVWRRSGLLFRIGDERFRRIPQVARRRPRDAELDTVGENALSVFDDAVAILGHELYGIRGGHRLPVLRHGGIEYRATLDVAELRGGRRTGSPMRPTEVAQMYLPSSVRRRRGLAGAPPSISPAATMRIVLRAC